MRARRGRVEGCGPREGEAMNTTQPSMTARAALLGMDAADVEAVDLAWRTSRYATRAA